ncbi:uncharacterized protein LOC128883850 isoform X1 [Hylaeus volcanicus]|uniref:uncharacterized protein LOC128883850 isoform X1 n=1 Tax=Hylaeus volcanicus TaxID=313075 RepID=UPI0023B80CF0|nr:uncharacterized protein LOC128883850 isoform X1 [Hylaeus volcanicus]
MYSNLTNSKIGQQTSHPVVNTIQTTSLTNFSTGILTSFFLTVFTELGDRTFFITSILVLSLPSHLVFWGSWIALVLQTILSTLFGYCLHLLPTTLKSSSYLAYPFDDYAAAIFLLVFACQHTWKWYHATSVSSHTSSSLSQSYVSLPSKEVFDSSCTKDSSKSKRDSFKKDDIESLYIEYVSPHTKSHETTQSLLSTHNKPSLEPCSFSQDANLSKNDNQVLHDDRVEAQKIVGELQPQKINKTTLNILLRVFWVIFISELGDKSMFSTVALATTQNPFAVCLGGSLAHCFVTLLATLTGSLFEKHISEQLANGIGALLFFFFAIFTVAEGLHRQGILLWRFLNLFNIFPSSYTSSLNSK